MANGGRAIPEGAGDPFQDLLTQLVVEQFLAQQDATSTENVNPDFEAGTGADFLRSLFGTALDFTPGVGDVKAAGFDAPQQFAEGENIAGIVSLLSALPGIGILGDLIRAGGRGAARGAGNVIRSTTGARADALRPLRSAGGREAAGGAEDPLGSLLEQISGGGRVSSEAAQSGAGDIGSIREQIFKELVQPDPFGEAEGIRRSLIDQIEELAQKRAGGN
jgi:hypothetical protein